MAHHELELLLQCDSEVAESPAWSVEDQALYWIDIHKCTMNRFEPASGVFRSWDLPSMPGCFVFRDGGGAVIPCRDGIYEMDFATGQVSLVLDPPYDRELYRFNDGKCDRAGRLWVGTMPVDIAQIGKLPSKLYRFDGADVAPQLDIDMANGLAFSADGKTMYRAETARRIVYAYDFDQAAGTAANERVFTVIGPGKGAPDGATVDTEGGYWVALPAGEVAGAIARFKPNGDLDFRIETEMPAPVMMNFGGPDMSTLYVTTAQFERFGGHPGAALSGNLYKMETGFTGVPEPKFVARAS